MPDPVSTLQKRAEHLAPRLKQRVTGDDLEEPLQAIAPLLNDVIGEAIGKDLCGQSRSARILLFGDQ